MESPAFLRSSANPPEPKAPRAAFPAGAGKGPRRNRRGPLPVCNVCKKRGKKELISGGWVHEYDKMELFPLHDPGVNFCKHAHISSPRPCSRFQKHSAFHGTEGPFAKRCKTGMPHPEGIPVSARFGCEDVRPPTPPCVPPTTPGRPGLSGRGWG